MAQPVAPEYIVLHTNVGGLFAKGDILPPGTYSEEQLARLVGLGAIQAVDPVGEAFANPMPRPAEADAGQAGLPPSPASEAPTSAEAFKTEQDALAIQAAGGAAGGPDGDAPDPLAELDDEQQDALRAAGFGTAEAIRSASDDELDAVPGVGPATVKKLKATVGAGA